MISQRHDNKSYRICSILLFFNLWFYDFRSHVIRGNQKRLTSRPQQIILEIRSCSVFLLLPIHLKIDCVSYLVSSSRALPVYMSQRVGNFKRTSQSQPKLTCSESCYVYIPKFNFMQFNVVSRVGQCHVLTWPGPVSFSGAPPPNPILNEFEL